MIDEPLGGTPLGGIFAYTSPMNQLLADLYGHQAWADAEHWRAIGAHPSARDDQAIRVRLHHIHIVQRAFLWAVTDQNQKFVMTTPEDFGFEDLNAFACAYHDDIRHFITSVDDGKLAATIGVPWFKDPPLTLTVAEALAQCAMHSHYHRGQNATRLRELGGEPPPTDLIVWYWKRRPEPEWKKWAPSLV